MGPDKRIDHWNNERVRHTESATDCQWMLTRRDDGDGRTNAERSVVHVDQYWRAWVAGASTFCYEQYSRAADTRRTLLHRVGPSCRGPRVDTGTPSLPADVVLRPRPAGGCESSVDRGGRILRSRARRALLVPACSMHFSFIFIPWHIRGNTPHTREALFDLFARVSEKLRAYTFFIICCFLCYMEYCTFILSFCLYNICVGSALKKEADFLVNFSCRSSNFNAAFKL